MEEIYRSEGHYIKNASGAEAQAAAGRGTSNNTSQAVSPVSAASGGPTLADVCRLKIRYQTGTVCIFLCVYASVCVRMCVCVCVCMCGAGLLLLVVPPNA